MLHQNKNEHINIALVEDHFLVRHTFKSYINQCPGFKVVFDGEDGAVLLRALNSKPIAIDVLLLDLFSPGTDGRETLNEISKRYPSIRTVVLSACTDLKIISTVFDLGAYGYVSKTSVPEELCEAIISAAKGNVYRNKFYWSHQHMNFTSTEIKVLELIWLEKSNEEIASIMYSSLSTIEKIKHQLKTKTNTKTTFGLIKYALERRLLIPGWNDLSDKS